MTDIIRNEIALKNGVIHCQKCEDRIKRALTSIEGVLRVDVDNSTHKVSVNFDRDKLDSERIEQVLEHIGFPLATGSESPSDKT